MKRVSFALAGALVAGLALCPAPAGHAEPVPAADPVGPLDLDRAVAVALERNPGLLATEERRSELAATIREAKSEIWPDLALVSSWSRSRNPAFLNSPDFEGFLDLFPGESFEPGEQELYALALEIRQTLFSWGKTAAGIDLAELAAEIVDAQIEVARLDTALAAAEAYFELLAARRSLETIEIQEAVRRAALEVVEARFELGDATRLELLQAESSLADLAPLVAGARGREVLAEQALRVALGLPSGEPIAVAAVAEAPEGVGNARPEAVPTARLVAEALARRPELRDLELQDEALDEQVTVTLADNRPQAELVASLGREARLVDNISDPLYDNWRVSLGMRWEFYNGGERRAAVEGLDSQRRQLGHRKRDLVQRVTLEVERARTSLATARERLEAAELAAAAAGEAQRVAAESYAEGVALQADVLDAQQRAVLAELARVNALFDVRLEAARLARSIGSLPASAARGGDESDDVTSAIETSTAPEAGR